VPPVPAPSAGLARVAVAASIAAVTALAACSSTGAGATHTSTAPTTTRTVSAPATSAPPSTPAALSTPAAPDSAPATGNPSAGNPSARIAACAESQLRAGVSAQTIPGLDRHVVRIVFTNISARTCTLTGFPGAAIEDSSGAQVQQAERVVGGPVAGTVERVATIPVAPGKTVFAYLEGRSTREQGAAQAGCDGPKFPRILVTPPNTRTPVPFTIGWPQCYAFDVHPVREQ
jgi:hypothetical protein